MEYSSVRRGRMESTVKVLPATEGRPECNGVVFVFADGRKTPGARYARYSTVADTVEKLRRERVVRIGRHVQEHQQYIAWQESRIRDWKLAELQPVTKGAQ